MRRRRADRRAWWLVVAAIALGACDQHATPGPVVDACGRGPRPIDAPEPERYEVAFRDRGRLALIWQWGRIVPSHGATLTISDASQTRKLSTARPSTVQWIAPDRLLYQHDWRGAAPDRGPFVIDLGGRVIRDFEAPRRLESPVVSPDGRWIANTQWDEHGNATFEVLPFDGSLNALGTRDDLRDPVWSFDSAYLLARRVALPRGVPRGVYGRELRLPRDLSSEEPLRENRESDRLGYNEVVAEWWAPDGIYGIGNGVLQRCDPDGAGCVEVYRPRVEGSLRGVTPGPEDVAYLLVNEEDPCFLESGAREIHRLELASGRTERLLHTPAGVLLTGIDWVDVPGAEPPVEFPAASRKER